MVLFKYPYFRIELTYILITEYRIYRLFRKQNKINLLKFNHISDHTFIAFINQYALFIIVTPVISAQIPAQKWAQKWAQKHENSLKTDYFQRLLV